MNLVLMIVYYTYESDPLWDGRGCPAGDDCCSILGAPWFYRYFTVPENGAVEVRICRDESYSNEATLLKQVAMYIQWTLSAMTSKNKNGGNSMGTLYREPMERLVFRYY